MNPSDAQAKSAIGEKKKERKKLIYGPNGIPHHMMFAFGSVPYVDKYSKSFRYAIIGKHIGALSHIFSSDQHLAIIFVQSSMEELWEFQLSEPPTQSRTKFNRIFPQLARVLTLQRKFSKWLRLIEPHVGISFSPANSTFAKVHVKIVLFFFRVLRF